MIIFIALAASFVLGSWFGVMIAAILVMAREGDEDDRR